MGTSHRLRSDRKKFHRVAALTAPVPGDDLDTVRNDEVLRAAFVVGLVTLAAVASGVRPAATLQMATSRKPPWPVPRSNSTGCGSTFAETLVEAAALRGSCTYASMVPRSR